MTKFTGISLVSILILALRTDAGETGYYVQNGESAVHVEGDPRSAAPLYWQVRLYQCGISAKGGRGNWGSINGKSAEAVMRELNSCQMIQRDCERINHHQDCEHSYFNYLGPIAVMKAVANVPSRETEPQFVEVFKRLNDLYERIKPFAEALKQIDDAAKGKPSNPYENVGKEVKEYVENLNEAKNNLNKLSRALNDDVDMLLPKFDEAFNQIEANLETVSRNKANLSEVTGKSVGDWRNSLGEIRYNDAKLVVSTKVSQQGGMMTLTCESKQVFPGGITDGELFISTVDLKELPESRIFIGKVNQPYDEWQVTISPYDHANQTYKQYRNDLTLNSYTDQPADRITLSFADKDLAEAAYKDLKKAADLAKRGSQ